VAMWKKKTSELKQIMINFHLSKYDFVGFSSYNKYCALNRDINNCSCCLTETKLL
jgi:hypothetical protein